MDKYTKKLDQGQGCSSDGKMLALHVCMGLRVQHTRMHAHARINIENKTSLQVGDNVPLIVPNFEN